MKTVVITGSARGLGFEMAKEFRKYNYNVVLTCPCNVTSFEDVSNLLNTTINKFNEVDVWINNAGVNQPNKPLYELSQKEIDLMIDVDLKGAVYGSKIAYAKMKEQGHGQIYSIDGYGSNDAMMLGLTMYGTSKRGLTYFMQALAKEATTMNDNILVGRLSPGIMITDFLVNANNDSTKIELPEKTKKVYNILGDYPDVIAAFLVKKVVNNTKNNQCFMWLTGGKAFRRFMCAGFNKRDFFAKKD